VTPLDPISVVKQAIDKTRRNALQQIVLGAIGAALMTFAWGPTTFVIVMLAIDAIVFTIVGRRWLRLRASGPAVRALLDDPSQVREIAAWPRKLPPNRMPVFLDIFTKDGATCSLLLDQKNPQSTANLLGALHMRSPDALLSIPKLPTSNLA
jgi:hypothetical protein